MFYDCFLDGLFNVPERSEYGTDDCTCGERCAADAVNTTAIARQPHRNYRKVVLEGSSVSSLAIQPWLSKAVDQRCECIHDNDGERDAIRIGSKLTDEVSQQSSTKAK